MPQTVSSPYEKETTSERVRRHGKELWDHSRVRGAAVDCPEARTLRFFSLAEVAEMLSVSGSYLRQMSIDGLGPTRS